MGTPSPPYPPLYMSFCQFRGDNPLYNEFKNFGKNCSPTHKWGGGIVFQNTTPLLKKVLICQKKFLENFGENLTMFGELINFPQR